MKPLLIAHKGDTLNYAENTIEAFSSAFKQGAEGIEFDVQLVKERLVVVHNYLYDSQKEYPLLEKILQEFISKGRLEIEIKSFTLEILFPLTMVLSTYEQSDIEITTVVFYLLPELRKSFPSKSLGAIFQPHEFESWMTQSFIERKVCEVMQTLQVDVAHLPFEILTNDLVTSLHKNGKKVHSHIPKNNINEEIALFEKFTELEVDQCKFDDIQLLKELK